jgi:hypothetical protein
MQVLGVIPPRRRRGWEGPAGTRLPRAGASAFLGAALVLHLARPSARADDSVAYKFENYREEDGRITVETQGATADEDIGPYGHLSLTGTIDAVAGATPTGRPAPPGSDQVVLTEIHTRRKAWSGDYAQQLWNVNIDAGFAESRESDYVSDGWSVTTLADFNEKNTTLRVGLAGTDNRVEVFFEPAYLPKHTNDAIVGITQVLGPRTFVTVNLSAGRETGYLSEPHKFVEKAIEILPNIYLEQSFAENSPDEREHEALYLAVDHAYPAVRGALEGSYRLYADTYGIVAHTLGASWIQHVGARWTLQPSVRLYQQSAARFYYYDLDDTTITPFRVPMGTAPYYSSDFRLSAEDTCSYGAKAVFRAAGWLQLDAAYEEYVMKGRDGVTPASAYPRAGISSVGVRFLW